MSRRRILLAVSAVLSLSLICCLLPTAAHADDVKPIKVLLVTGGGSHDYTHQKDVLKKGLEERAYVDITIKFDPTGTNHHSNPAYASDDWYKGYDVVIHDISIGQVKDLQEVRRILKPHKAGLPAVILHSGMHAFRTEGWDKAGDFITPWFEFTGLATTGHGRQEPISIHYIDRESPITKGLPDWTTMHEELYNNAGGLLPTAHPLARGKQTVMENGKEVTHDNIVTWTNLYNGKTRVFATTIGHNTKTVADPRYLDLVTRGLLWSVDKLDDPAYMKPMKKHAAESAAE